MIHKLLEIFVILSIHIFPPVVAVGTTEGVSIPPDPKPKTAQVKAVKKTVKPKAAVVSKPKPKPAPVASTSGCVTGYGSSNYALNQLIAHESGGRSCAENAGGCFGLLQACPGAPLKVACGGNPSCQIQWFIDNKTGGRSWEQIWSLWQVQGWW